MSQLILAEKTAAALARIVKQPPHALLLVAPDGAGKRAVARQLAADLLGLAVDKLNNSGHVYTIDPPSGETISVEQVRELQHFMLTKGHRTARATSRVVILTDAHRMTREAQNALLKLLEEPPVGAMLLMTATGRQSLLATIVSRCQVVNVTKPLRQQTEDYFLQLPGVDHAAVSLAYNISGGLPGLLATILTDDQDHPLTVAAASARQVLAATTFQRLAMVDSLAKQRETCIDLCRILQQMAQTALPAAATASVERWQRVLTAANQCQAALESRVNTKLALTQLMVSL